MSSEAYILNQISEIKNNLSENPRDADLLHDLGVGYHLLGRYDDAIVELRKALAYIPNNKTYLFNLANAYAESNNLELAIKTYHDVLDIDCMHIPSLSNLADCYERLGSTNKAFEIFEYVTRIASENALSYFNFGNFLLRNNRHIEAVKCYKQSIMIEPTFTDAYHNISWILFETGAYHEAENYAKMGLDTDPENSSLQELLRKILDHFG